MTQHDCPDCAYVGNAEVVFLHFVPREKREQVGSTPEFIGNFTMNRWSGHAAFYLFRCRACMDAVIDYPHGYTGGGFLYLRCPECGFQLVMDTPKFAEIYRREGMPQPPGFWEQLKTAWKVRRALRQSRQEAKKRQRMLAEEISKIEERGIRVIVDNDRR